MVLHGGPDIGHRCLVPGLEPLAHDHHVVIFDFRGCGRSSRDLPEDALQPEYVIDDARRLIDRLGLGRVDLLGFSTGGGVATAFVQQHPEQVRRLIKGLDQGDWSYQRYLDGRMHPWVVGDAEAILRDWGGPILILHGEQDMGFPLAERLHAALPTSELGVITGAAHLCHFEKPEE